MGEISFKYDTHFKPIHEFSFKYWFEKSIEYSFAYQRYVAFSDTSIFNSPVAITKVATGLSQLYDLFVDKGSHSITYFSLIQSFNELKYDTKDETLSFTSKIKKETEYNNLCHITIPHLLMHMYSDIDFFKKANNWKLELLLQNVWFSMKNNLNIFENTYTLNKYTCMDIYQQKHLKYLFDKELSLYNIFGAKLQNKHTHKKILNVFKEQLLQYKIPITNVIQQINLYHSIYNDTITNSCDLAHNNNKMSNLLDIEELTNKEKQAQLASSHLLYKRYNDIDLLGLISSYKIPFNANKIKNFEPIIRPINKSFYQKEFCMYIYDSPLCIFDIDTFTTQERKYGFTIKSEQVYRSFKNLNTYKKEYNIIKLNNEINLYDEFLWLNTVKDNISNFSNIFLNKKVIQLQEYNDLYSLSIMHTNIKYLKEGHQIKKRSNQMSFNENIDFISKNSSMMTIRDSSVFNYKDNKKMDILFSSVWIDKESYSETLYEQQLMFSKNESMSTIYRKMQQFLKQKIITDAPDIESVIKYRIPVDYSNTLHSNFKGMIIPISKVRNQAYINSIDSKIRKLVKRGYLENSLSFSVIPKNSYIQTLDLFCDKQEHEAFLEYKNIHISKAKIHVAINKDKFITENPIDVCVEPQIWINKTEVNTFITDSIWIKKQANKAQIKNIIDASVTSRDTYCYNTLFVDKMPQVCYYDYGMTWADKSFLKTQLHQLHAIDKSNKSAIVLDCVSPFIKKEIDAFYNYGVFNDKIIKNSAIFKEMDTVQKLNKDCGLHPNDFGNWAWVYETPDPFDGINYGIDELLLPENDTRYEGFEDIIFNKETMMPRNPVKQIDENTFIAKYPIRHPLSSKYANVAVDYDKSAINFENYYGIEIRIMHTVFLKFYRIWQSKIFEFGTMTMVQSVKLILEYLYSWIMEYFPLEEIEQALRVFKLIRWYGESSIIQNSQYIVSYEYGTLESKLNTGECMIPNNLGPDNSTMYVDNKLGVIRNDPNLLRISNAYVEFYINNKKNTAFTFSLSNTIGSVNIYINEVLVDTISKSALNLTYELPYTGDINVVRIEKEAAHNLNATFYIGNIKIPNGTFKELSIDFDPTLKAGNKPLNEIAKKMIAAANLYDNREEVYDAIRKGNLGINELYKKLTEYWELHHQGKSKGKRLTIKEI